MVEEKRQHKRSRTLNLVSYVCLDENNNHIGEGIGRTLNISEGGLLIETHDKIDAKYILLLAVGFGAKVVDIRCQVAYSRQGATGMYESGVRFLEIDKKVAKIIKRLVEKFYNVKETEQEID